MRELAACPLCGHSEGTLVCEYNRFLLLDQKAPLIRYDYTLCHRCGLVYARHRPAGAEYTHMLLNFNESLGRADSNNPLLNPRPLTAAQREEIRQRTSRGVFLHELTSGVSTNEWMPSLLSDRLSTGAHAMILGSLLDLRRKRVLEVRSRTGAILAALRQWFDCDVSAMAIFESQKVIIEATYGIPVASLIDFENFRIPYDGRFDLIICKHMFTHALDPAAFFAHLRSRLAEGGALYLYAEPDDLRATKVGKSIFQTLNPFHMQSFDERTLDRCLRMAGFVPTFMTTVEEDIACLAKVDRNQKPKPIPQGDLDARRERYRQWRDSSVVALDEEQQHPFTAEVDSIQKRLLERGEAEVDKRGRIVPLMVKPKKKPKEQGAAEPH